ncbi:MULTISPECIES: hypothetical protein [unclassified Carboxylicivirga]|uniref:hypothetical protein n=1 Tax=Carboxylicivirga TaxID=1628153 RepID=UPI003D331A9F
MNKRLLTFLLILIAIHSFGQNNTSSSYSRFGIGLIESKADATLAGMGHTGVALSSSGYLNNINAASYSALDSAHFLFNIQGKTSFAKYQSNTSQQNNFDANIESLSMGFRAGRNWGMGFSLSPYSSVGYKIDGEKYILGTTQTYPTQYLGEGGISQISWHNGFALFKNLSLGISASYLWGSSDIIEVSYYPSIIGETTYNERNYHIATFLLQYGFQWQHTIGQNTLTLGATANIATELDTYYKQLIYNDYTSDLSSNTKQLNNALIPCAYQAGVSYANSKGWTLATDFRYDLWDKSELKVSNGKTRNTLAGSIGIQHKPTRYYSAYYRRIHYRLGAFYNQEYLSIQEKNIDSKGLTAGITLPMADGSRINLAYEYKKSGTRQAGLVKETYQTIRIGLSFNERWFQKRTFK